MLAKLKKHKILILIGAIGVVLLALVISIAVLTGNKPVASRASVFPDNFTLETFRGNAYEDPVQTLKSTYGLTEEQASSLINDEDDWHAYTLEINVENKTKDGITVYALDVRRNGRNNVWLSTDTGEPKIGRDNATTLYVSAIVKGKDVPADTAANRIKGYSIKLEYSVTPTTNRDGVESVETRKEIKVK
jgi:hypothetical protein